MKLTQEQKRIRLAEAAGWKKDKCLLLGDKEYWSFIKEGGGYAHNACDLPDYERDLNAMHDLEVKLYGDAQKLFRHYLIDIEQTPEDAISASCANRFECIGRALGLWKEGE